jgi:2-hydroxy-6-oxonona-2,4-dienedioate hydrolase
MCGSWLTRKFGDMTRPREAQTTGDRAAVDEFTTAQCRLLEHFGVRAESRFVNVSAIEGRAQVLVAGEGAPLMMVIGDRR